ncbi:hypothetical protein CBL_09950 [Carabus blaptoides fortunei]
MTSIKNLGAFPPIYDAQMYPTASQRVLEEFTLLKMCETIYEHNQELLRQLRMKDMAFESLRTKYITLQKQITNMDIVQTRIFSDMRKVKEPRDVVPVKFTRSVGLQKKSQPASAATNRFYILPPPPSVLTPTPAHITPPFSPTGKGIKTILPKISIQKSPTTSTSAATASLRRPSDEKYSNRTSTSPGIKSSSGKIRIVTDLRNSDNSNHVFTVPGTQ